MKKILLTCFMLVFVLHAWAQDRTVSGKVTDAESGEGLPGVNVLLKGTSQGVNTDLDGNYKISVPSDGGTLVFTFIGMAKQQVAIGSRSVIDVPMESDVQQLSEVVVTAFGVERQEKAIGYATQQVSGDDITKTRETNVVNSLSGRISGVNVTSASGQPGSSSRIVLRGANSLTGNNQPLFVIDGIPIDNSTSGSANSTNDGPFGGVDHGNGAMDINPNDIASINVLKGANAAALYGSRASNGVILITTKSGKGTEGIGVSVSSNTTFNTPLRLPDFQNSYGQGASLYNFEYVDGSNGDGGIDESWGPALDQGYEFTQWNSYQNGGAPLPWVSQSNNVRDMYDTGIDLQNSISVAGSNDQGSFRLSYTNLDSKGMIPNTDYSRNNIGLKAAQTLSDNLKADFGVNYVKAHSDNKAAGGYSAANPVQQTIWSGRNVDFQALRDHENLPRATAGTGAGIVPVNWNTRYQNNPFWALDNNLNGYDKDRVYGYARLTYDFTENLSLFVRSGIDSYNQQQSTVRAVGTNENPNGFFSTFGQVFSESNSDFLLNYNNDFATDFSVNASFGGNVRINNYSSIYGEATELQIPGVYNLSNVRSGITPVYQNYSEQKNVQSLYGSAQFGYLNAIFLDVTARNDWSSTLPLDNNSFFYPSASLSVVVSDLLDFGTDALSFLKVRGSWAQVGNDTEPYELQQTISFARDPFGTILEPTEGNRLLNPELKPEITTSTEFGLDARFFSGRANLQATYYNAVSTDQIVPVQITGSTGYTSRVANVGRVRNSGIELQLTADIIRNDDFQWSVFGNWSWIDNEVESLGGDLEALTLGGQWNVDVQARVGEPYGVLYGPAYLKDPEGNIVHDANGLPRVDETFRELGNVTPDWTGGLGTSLTYKGVTLSTLVDAKWGNDIYSMTTTWGRYAGILEETLLGRETGLVGDGVIQVGEDSYVPNNIVATARDYNKRAFSNSVAEGSVFDGSFIKWRELSIGYTLPNSLLGDFPMRDISVNLIGRNLAILYTKIPHIDPETSFGTSNGNQGLEFGQLPSARSMGFNVNFKF